MAHTRVSDADLRAFLASGHSQADAARHFGVSEPAPPFFGPPNRHLLRRPHRVHPALEPAADLELLVPVELRLDSVRLAVVAELAEDAIVAAEELEQEFARLRLSWWRWRAVRLVPIVVAHAADRRSAL
jgi:hypothetical protein